MYTHRIALLTALALLAYACLSCGSEFEESASPDTDPDVTEFINLIGTWERAHKSGRYEYIFRDDGTYTKNAYDLDTRSPLQSTDGQFSLSSGIMTLTVFSQDDGNEEVAKQSKPYALLESTWYSDQVYRHSIPDASLESGSWEMVEKHYTYKTASAELTLDSTRVDTLTFSTDGTYLYDAELKDENGKLIPNPSTGQATVNLHLSGTYFIEDGVLYAHDDQADRAFGMSGDRIYHDDNSWRYERIK